MLVPLLVTAAMLAGSPSPAPPPVNAVVDYQLGGAYRPAAKVEVVTRDRTERVARGGYTICYLNAYQTQPGELRWWREHHPRLLLRDRDGDLVRDPGWRREVLLDTSSASKRKGIARVVGTWIAGCAADGFAAVEPDNLDSFTRSRRLLDRRDNLALARRLAVRAHRRDLAIAQKNLAGVSRAERRRIGFDFAVAEECAVYRECRTYTRVYGRQVIEIEYTDNGRRAYRRSCAARGDRLSILLRDRTLRPRGKPGFVYRSC